MNIELELLEQLLDDDWGLPRAVAFVDSLGKCGWEVILHHWTNGNVRIVDGDGNAVPDWHIHEVFRHKDAGVILTIGCTAKGARLV